MMLLNDRRIRENRYAIVSARDYYCEDTIAPISGNPATNLYCSEYR
nr:MAG TPA: hypothetical protein [Caudoviricetes sp.]